MVIIFCICPLKVIIPYIYNTLSSGSLGKKPRGIDQTNTLKFGGIITSWTRHNPATSPKP